ncbi:hypothetical protein CK203_022589 [Vitis vinifera]|uniref:Uncharacterized protein n=1 Tax=Vitis vinifera TaxID=29760 RepID=A0A438JEC4_VITVI|nr:hypothetical protein CK203_022589 [Vitis vinifera]
MIEEPVNAAPHSISSGPGRMSGLNHSGPSLVAAARLANVAEEESKSLPSVGNSGKSYLEVTYQRLARGKLVHFHGWKSLALPSVAQRSSLRHVSGSFRRNSIALYKKAAKFSQQKADFATLWSDLLEMAVTPSFQLRIVHRLKHWILDFLSFEMEAASINHPGNLNPDADAAETAPLEEAGAESQSQPSDDPDRLAIVLVKGPPLKKPRLTRDLQSGLFERLQERQQEIEISCASAHDAHPDGGEVEMATETSAAPAIIPAEDASGPMCPDEDMGVPIPGQELPSPSSPEEESADDAAPASPFSYAELEVKLKQITPDWRAIKPSAQMFDMIETTADYMRTFSSRRQEIENQLRLRMEEAEASLSTMREENEALRVELAEAKGREESTAGRLHEAEGEAARLRDELSQLRTEVLNEKKQKEDLQLRLDVQKEELEREFAVEREELAADYQQQVDDTFIFGYRCCMKKNGIKRDTLQFLRVKKRSSIRSPLPDSLSLFAISLL